MGQAARNHPKLGMSAHAFVHLAFGQYVGGGRQTNERHDNHAWEADMTADTVPAAVLPKPPSMNRLIVAATIGNVFEWFDFVVYGFFAVTLAQVFFPTGDPTVSLLVTFGAFGLAYVVRPLGAIVVGGYTDRAGRKAGLLLSMALMMIGTTLMAVTPGYATIGLAAPIIITIARLLQGFSVGGEFGSAVTFLAEHGGGRRGFSASWQFATGGIITALASLFGVGLTTLLTHQELVDWGWRIPYLFGMLIGPAGLYVRSKVVDTPEFIAAEKPETIPIKDLLRRHPLPVLLSLGISIISNSSFYLMLYIPTFGIKQLHCRIYRLYRNSGRRPHPGDRLPARRPLVRQDGAPVDHGDNVLAVRADRLPGLLPDGRLAVAGGLRHRRRMAARGQGGL